MTGIPFYPMFGLSLYEVFHLKTTIYSLYMEGL